MHLILSDNISEEKILLPSSKSVTHRILILSAINKGKTVIQNPLFSDDTLITIEALKSFGAEIEVSNNKINVLAPIGKVKKQTIQLGNSGSSARFLIPIASFLDKPITFDGTEELRSRPFSELIEILQKHNVIIEHSNGTLPITVHPSQFTNSENIEIKKIPSSQIVSGLMFAGLLNTNKTNLTFESEIPSVPYVKMTSKIMKRLGIILTYSSKNIEIPPQEIKYDWNYICEKDLSATSYWVAFALINNVKVVLSDLLLPSMQGDEAILEIAEILGGKVTAFHNRVEIFGKIKNGLEYDCENIPDIVPTLAVIGMFAPEKFVLKNVSRLKYKESDRIFSTIENIRRLGGKAEYIDGDLIIHSQSNYLGSEIKTFNDHRIAMAFAIAGTKIPNTIIENPSCVEKSYPNFWQDFKYWTAVK